MIGKLLLFEMASLRKLIFLASAFAYETAIKGPITSPIVLNTQSINFVNGFDIPTRSLMSTSYA